jgi:ACS family pantothenate transporter-like MFS transporter
MSKEEGNQPYIDIQGRVETSSLGSHEIKPEPKPDYAITTIPFQKSLDLFFNKSNPPKVTRGKFFFWFPPDQTKEEKLLVFKLDITIMTYVCLSYFVRYLDATNISSAYITGMKEDLNITGEEYVWLTQLFSAAYCFAGFFGAILLTKIRFSRLLPAMEIIWGLLCLFIYKAQNFKTIAVLRFFQGFCEGFAWPCIHYILGSWYTKQELGKRTSIFTASGIAGVLLSGLIQSGLQRSLHGTGGLAGWRWLFIIDAVVTFPIAILGFLFVPDSPETTKKKFYLTSEELDLARERTKVDGRDRVNKLDLSTFKRVFTSYQWYLFVIAWVLWGFGGTLQSYFGIVLKALGYDVYDRNNIPSATSGVGILACIISGFIVDILGRRLEMALFLQVLWITGAVIIKVYDVPRASLIFGYSILGVYYATSPIIVGWCNELCKEDNQLRAATIGSLNLFSGLLGIPYSIQLFNPDFAPKFTKGSTATLVITILLFFYFFVILAFDRYQNRKREYIKQQFYDTNEGVIETESLREKEIHA